MAYGSSAFGSESYGGSSNITPLSVITFFLSGYLSKSNITITLTLDAKIVSRLEKTFTLDAKIVSRLEKTFTLDTSLQKSFSKTFTINAYLKKFDSEKTFTINSKLIHRREKSFNVNAILQKTFTKTFKISARCYVKLNWLSGWKRRKKSIIDGGATTKLNSPKRITIYKGFGTDTCNSVYINNVREDFGDIRFTKQDGTTLLSYIRESYITGVSAVFWVQIDYIPESPDTTFIYMYYNNSAATYDGTLPLPNILTSQNLNPDVPSKIGSTTCVPFYDETFLIDIPQHDDAYIALQGLTTEAQLLDNANGIIADDLYVLNVNDNFVFMIKLISEVPDCSFSTTAIGRTVMKITDNISDLKDTTANFRVRGINSQGGAESVNSAAVYFTRSFSIFSCVWGIEEIISLSRTISRTHRVGLRIING